LLRPLLINNLRKTPNTTSVDREIKLTRGEHVRKQYQRGTELERKGYDCCQRIYPQKQPNPFFCPETTEHISDETPMKGKCGQIPSETFLW
jgi:hypothetical protein